MKLFDAHCHLQDPRIFDKAPQLIAAAVDSGVVRFAVNGVSEVPLSISYIFSLLIVMPMAAQHRHFNNSIQKDWHLVKQISESYPCVIPCFGLHPWYVAERTLNWLNTLKQFFEATPSAAVGEIGLDKGSQGKKVDFTDQVNVFRQQLGIAKELKRPASIHCVHAFGELLQIMKYARTHTHTHICISNLSFAFYMFVNCLVCKDYEFLVHGHDYNNQEQNKLLSMGTKLKVGFSLWCCSVTISPEFFQFLMFKLRSLFHASIQPAPHLKRFLAIATTGFHGSLSLARRLILQLDVFMQNNLGEGIICFSMASLGPFPAGVILHSYLGSAEMVPEFANLGAYFSFSGFLMSMEVHKAKRMLKMVPSERILLETDAPDALPKSELDSAHLVEGASLPEELQSIEISSAPFDGARDVSTFPKEALNHPENIHKVLIYVASLVEMTKEELAEVTYQNAGERRGGGEGENEGWGWEVRMRERELQFPEEKMRGDGGIWLEIAGVSGMRDDDCSMDVCLWKERKKMEAWVALAYFQQLDESFIKLLGDLTEEKIGSNGRTRLEIEGVSEGMLAFDEFLWLLGGLQQPRQLDFSMWARSHPLLFLVFLPKLEEKEWARVLVKKVACEFAQAAGDNLFDQAIGTLLSHAYPYVWAQEMSSSFGAPRQPKTSTSWPINEPREYLAKRLEEELFANEIAGGDVRDAKEVGEARGIGAFANVWEVREDPWTFMSVMLHKKRIFVDDRRRRCDVNFRI
ncbi:unnamed protein product [Prunus armeniaca]|uniref:TatD related DNase n=1 Tax=Prunus armeniaca TaxID=36596 RepID=A0A6J5Y454_PRUAR|nr:unnamed protein product [Prunus armeniaca]